MNESTINANIAACIEKANHFGLTRVYNICNGNVTDVPWGAWDWTLVIAGSALLGTAGIVVIMVFGVMGWTMFRDFR